MNGELMIRPTDDPVELGTELRAARKARRMTQAELAARAGVSERTVRHMEQGTKPTSQGVLGLVLRALDYDPDPDPSFDPDVELIVNTIGHRLSALSPQSRADLGARLIRMMIEDAHRHEAFVTRPVVVDDEGTA